MENKTMAIKTTIQLRRDTLANWLAKNPVLANGEIALVDKNNGVGEKNWVIRIGDGTTEFKNLPETAYALSSDVQAQVDALSAEISGKVKIDDVAASYINVKRIDSEAYHKLVVDETLDDQTIYIVSSDNLNAFGEKITNVGDAEAETDAVNLRQLNATKSKIAEDISAINKRIDTLDVNSGGQEKALADLSVELKGDITTLSTNIKTAYETADATLSGNLINVISNVSADINTTLTAVSDDLDELSGKVSSLNESLSAYDVSLTALGRDGDKFKYQLLQGGVSKGEIEVPYDVFVDKGEISTIGDKTYLLLTLNNADSTVLSIETTNLVDVYTGLTSDTVAVDVNGYQISATVVDGSITPEKLSQTAEFVFDCGGAD